MHTLLEEYEQFLAGKAHGTRDAYLRTARHLLEWTTHLSRGESPFSPSQLTKDTVELYLSHLAQQGSSLNHLACVRSTISNFAHFLIEEKGLLQRNPTRGIPLSPPHPPSLRCLTQEQRTLLSTLIAHEDQRGVALFSLVYWAGCRVSDISWLQIANTHVGPKGGWLHIGYKESKSRDIDLMEEASRPLYEYLQATHRLKRLYVFFSQRSERLTEEGIYYWFHTLKAQTPQDQWHVLQNLTLHNVRYDFAYRAREAGWSPEEVAYYLGYGNTPRSLSLPSPTSPVAVNHIHMRQRLKHIKG